MCLIFAFLVTPWYPESVSVWNVAGNVVFLQGICALVIPSLVPAWSLAIEVFYYAIAPILRKTKPFVISALIVISALVYCNYNSFRAADIDAAHELYGVNIAVFGWAWLIGWLAYRYRYEWWMLAVVLLIGGFLVLRPPAFGQYGPFTFIVSMLVILNAYRIPLKPADAKALEYLGEISYPLYLVHFPTMIALHHFIAKTEWNVAPVYIAASVFASVILYHGVDQPFRYRTKAAVTTSVPQ